MAIPVLNGGSWMSSPKDTLDQLFGWLLCTNKRQSNVFFDNITSIPDILNQNCNDPNECVYQLKSKLEKYFSNYFDTVSCEVTYAVQPKTQTFKLSLKIAVTKNGEPYTISYKDSVENGLLKNLTEAINN